MKHSLTSIALGALLFSQSVLAGLYSAKDNVVDLNQSNFQSEVMDSDHVVMVEFYAPWCGHCKNLVPQYKAAAENLRGIAKLGAIDCDNDMNKPLCSQYGIQGFPTIKVFPPSKSGKKGVKYPQDYQGERTAAAIAKHVVKMLPNDIQLVSSNPSSEKITNIDEFAANESTPRALLFTDKTESSAMYKGLATGLKGRMSVGEMRKPSEEVKKKYNITKLPSLVTFPKGSQIVDQAQFDQECLNKPRGSCVIAFLVVEPEFEESVKMHEHNLDILRQVKKAAFEANKPQHFMWMNALDSNVKALRDQFQISDDVPGLLLIHPTKKAFVPFIGRFDVEGIKEWLSDTSTGRARAFAYKFDVVLEGRSKDTKAEDRAQDQRQG
ncbi:protein disulfide isomerase (PDI) protein [Mortierella alpina]|uniref:protein disulfide-isomerase n=1 Tax=Mortierella alpina TaxID=64518 RepID=A0A9P6M1W3_MORAP|nr:protein disulfide isomerase (PDI) protein [Mortierella alpina]